MRIYILFVSFVLWLGPIHSQKSKDKTIVVTGTVSSYDKRPIKRAIIYVDSAKTKFKTNKSGIFKIRIEPSIETISAYSWNHGIETRKFTGDKEINIIFPKSESIMSEEKLADLGFETKRKKTTKKSKDYSEYLNMYQLIATEIPGAIVNGTTIRLRGVNSVQNGQDPLILVDGIPTGSIDNIFPKEVASVRVIRDQGTTLYGVRGSNGVILIELKK